MEFQLIFFVLLMKVSFFLTLDIKPPLVLTDLSGGHTVVGQKLVLKCKMTFHLDYILVQWDQPQNIYPAGVEEKPVMNKTAKSGYLTTAKLIVDKVSLNHSGTYRCKAVHRQRNDYVISDELWVPVYKPNEHFIEFANRSVNRFNVPEARIQFYIRAHPNISLYWTKGSERIGTSSSRYIIHTDPHCSYEEFNFCVTLQFKHISNEDFGIYTLMAKNNFGIRSQALSVELSGFDEPSLDIEYISEEDKLVTYVCKAVSDPNPKITFVSCHNEVCDKMKRKSEPSDYFVEKGLQTVSHKTLNFSKNGLSVLCLADMMSASDTLLHLPNGIGILGKNVQNDGTLDAAFGEYIKISCAAPSFGYVKGTRWYRNGRNLSQDSGHISISNEINDYNTLTVLGFRYNSQDREGNYTCESLSRSGKVRSRNVTLVLKRMLSFFPQISIQSSTGDYATVGGNITLKCDVTYYVSFVIGWRKVELGHSIKLEEFPKYPDFEDILSTTRTTINTSTYISSSKLEISRIKLTDAGAYVCLVYGMDSIFHNYIWFPVFGDNESVITFDDTKSLFDAAIMEINIVLRAYPEPTIQWLDNHAKQIVTTNSSKFSTSMCTIKDDGYNNYKITLAFKNISAEDFGNYTAIAYNQIENKSYSVAVSVTKSSTFVDVYKVDEENMTTSIKCTSISYPEPSLYWIFKECDFRLCLKFDEIFNYNPIETESFLKKEQMFTARYGLRHVSYVSVNFSEAGIFSCHDANSNSYASKVVSGFKSEFAVFAEEDVGVQKSNNIIEIEQSQKISLICAISASIYKSDIFWLYNDDIYYVFKKMTYNEFARKYDLVHSYASKMKISILRPKPDGNYTCNVLTKNGLLRSKTVQIKTQRSAYLRFVDTNMINDSVQVEVGNKWQFYCYVDAFPTPVIKWFKNDEPFLSSERVTFLDNDQVLDFENVRTDDIETYSCQVYSGFNKLFGTKTLIATTKFNWLYALIPALLAVGLLTFFVTLKLRKNRILLKEFKKVGLANFGQGEIENLNPEIMVTNQAVLLPYYEKWEIPMKYIKIGRQLGSGAFGIVFKAEIVNFFLNEDSKTVAVKTTHKNSSFECLKSLASELKIMVHLGKHVNVVNLIGACTKNLAKKELYVVVEYCHLGNLLEYLIKKKSNFVDQKDNTTDDFDWTIGPDTNNKHIELRYVNVKESEDKVEFSKVPHQEYICSKDLLVWAFQVARGMEYLGSRRVVHGDLAARNLLLTDDNVVKISDFGLAEKMYKYRDYVKKGDGPLPVKWLAVETIGKGIFSIQSDVWSFGVVLWEIFCLGETPYPGIDFSERFYKLLIDGYRMESPKSATARIYEMMLDCWKTDPVLRPSFANLAERIGSLLEASVKKRYIDMNDLYNQDRNSNSEDYLGKLSPPTFEHVLSETTLKYASIEHGYADDEDEKDVSNAE